MTHASPGREAVRLEEISKTFGSFKALDGVSIGLRSGQIHAIVGENGAGKSTLMNVLYGILQPSAGRIFVGGQDVTSGWSTREAIAHQIGMIHQHFSLVMEHSVLENIVMPTLKWTDMAPDWSRYRAEFGDLSGEFGFDLSPDAIVEKLSIGQRQQVEILKMLFQGAKILILDEPTAVLTPQQSERLLQMLLQLRDRGYAVVIITHKLEHALELSDQITVLRGGRRVATVSKGESTLAEIAGMMVSQEINTVQRRSRSALGPVILDMEEVSLEVNGSPSLDRISLQLREGEILGIAGVAGNGQSELAEILVGLRTPTGGRISLYGKDLRKDPVEARRRGGIAIIPEDRHAHAIVGEMDVASNFILGREDQFSWYGILDRKTIRDFAQRAIAEFDVRTRTAETKLAFLSGGNQQKVVVGRELSASPKLIVAHEPARGLDFAATAYIRQRLVLAAEAGAGVLLISSDLDELMELSTRVAVLYCGRVMGTVEAGGYDPDHLGSLMAGLKPSAVH